MEELRFFHDTVLRYVSDSFFRFRYEQINWNQQMIAIKGPRGTGKTTLMLQYIKYALKDPAEALYVTADHTYFYNHNLVDLAIDFVKWGGKILFIDEVHKYPKWSRELKNIYDMFPGLKVVFSASSALDIYRGEADLSRRVITYDLPGLSFREYLALVHEKCFPVYTLEDLVRSHHRITLEITEHFKPLPAFRSYLQTGYLPFTKKDTPGDYHVRINQILNTVIDFDLTHTEGYSHGASMKVKKLLGVLAESAPFKPNIAAIAAKLDISRDSVYTYLNHLEHARLLNFLAKAGKGISLLQKPDKLFLENSNIAYCLKGMPDTGTLRETFLMNQLVNKGLEVTQPDQGDFLVNNLYIEVGGKNKTAIQVKDKQNYLIAADDIETGFNRKLPLWLFGFLY